MESLENSFASPYVLVVIEPKVEIDHIKEKFFGAVCESFEDCPRDAIVYFYGDYAEYERFWQLKHAHMPVRVIAGSYNYDPDLVMVVQLGEVPIDVHGVGVYFREFFPSKRQWFTEIEAAHTFQSLTESNKPGTAYRSGIYLTPTKATERGTEFHLLRCSSNFKGSSDNFRDVDCAIRHKVQEAANEILSKRVHLNHVLAQIYTNRHISGKQRKAKIKEHSDKTKDMPKDAAIVFCTFYKGLSKYQYKNQTTLTKLRFKLKNPERYARLAPHFDLELHPNSAFFITLRTNRIYTHEIVPSALSIDQIPTRMGYVMRCSNTLAVHRDGTTYIIEDGKEAQLRETQLRETQLHEMTDSERKEIKKLYALENATDAHVVYPETYSSMNQGDCMAPFL
jgi:hypothetical protein